MITFKREDENTVLVSLEDHDRRVISSILNEASLLYEKRPSSTSLKDKPHLETTKAKIAKSEGSSISLKDNEVEAFGRAVNEVGGRVSYLDDVSQDEMEKTYTNVSEQYQQYRYNMI